MKHIPQWLDWANRIQAIAQSGLTYAKDVYDIERYQLLRELAAEIVSAELGDEQSLIVERFNAQTGYATPKVDVRGVVFQDGKLLLVQERSDMGWTLPGGWCDIGETAAENVVKEIYEESGFLTRAVKLLAVYDNFRHPHVPQSPFETYKFIFRCEIIGGKPRISSETADVAFFAKDEIPVNLSGGRVTSEQLVRFFAHYRHPNWPTDFD